MDLYKIKVSRKINGFIDVLTIKNGSYSIMSIDVVNSIDLYISTNLTNTFIGMVGIDYHDDIIYFSLFFDNENRIYKQFESYVIDFMRDEKLNKLLDEKYL